MDKVRIVVDEFEDFDKRIVGAFWSKIYVSVGVWSFPDSNWTDATSSVIKMWLEEFLALLAESPCTVLMYFMDGDFKIKIASEDRNTAFAEFIGPYNEVLFATEIDVMYLGRQLLSASSKIVGYYSHCSNLREMQEIIDASNKLRKVIIKKGSVRDYAQS